MDGMSHTTPDVGCDTPKGPIRPSPNTEIRRLLPPPDGGMALSPDSAARTPRPKLPPIVTDLDSLYGPGPNRHSTLLRTARINGSYPELSDNSDDSLGSWTLPSLTNADSNGLAPLINAPSMLIGPTVVEPLPPGAHSSQRMPFPRPEKLRSPQDVNHGDQLAPTRPPRSPDAASFTAQHHRAPDPNIPTSAHSASTLVSLVSCLSDANWMRLGLVISGQELISHFSNPTTMDSACGSISSALSPAAGMVLHARNGFHRQFPKIVEAKLQKSCSMPDLKSMRECGGAIISVRRSMSSMRDYDGLDKHVHHEAV